MNKHFTVKQSFRTASDLQANFSVTNSVTVALRCLVMSLSPSFPGRERLHFSVALHDKTFDTMPVNVILL